MNAVTGNDEIGATLEAYERWAPIYPPVAHNPLMRAEQRAMIDMLPDVRGQRVLDLACGSGRYSSLLIAAGAAEVVALDFCVPMLRQVAAAARVCASMMSLPFRGGSFDTVVSGLALGHATGVRPWMDEVARVLVSGGRLLYSDFHPHAARAGLTRSFKDQNDISRTVPHQLYDVASQTAAATAANLAIQSIREVCVGADLCEPFPGSESFYQEWPGLPIVLIVLARK